MTNAYGIEQQYQGIVEKVVEAFKNNDPKRLRNLSLILYIVNYRYLQSRVKKNSYLALMTYSMAS